jgi:hypothetical protein
MSSAAICLITCGLMGVLHQTEFFFFQYWGLNSGPTPWATLPTLFVMGFFWNRVSWTFFVQGWLQTVILLISASWIARITGVSPARSTYSSEKVPYPLALTSLATSLSFPGAGQYQVHKFSRFWKWTSLEASVTQRNLLLTVIRWRTHQPSSRNC